MDDYNVLQAYMDFYGAFEEILNDYEDYLDKDYQNDIDKKCGIFITNNLFETYFLNMEFTFIKDDCLVFAFTNYQVEEELTEETWNIFFPIFLLTYNPVQKQFIKFQEEDYTLFSIKDYV